MLRLAQHLAGLDEMKAQRGEELRHDARRAQRVRHQSAAAGAELGEDEGCRPAGAVPEIDAPQADQLAEDLADLRRSGEVAAPAERIARRVIAVFRMAER